MPETIGANRSTGLEDAIKARKLREALAQMAEEGVVQLFSPVDGTPPIVGVIGALQLDVLADRLGEEYGLPVAFDAAPCDTARWISAKDPATLATFIATHRPEIATDLDGDHVYLAASAFALSWTREKNPEIAFTDIKTLDKA